MTPLTRTATHGMGNVTMLGLTRHVEKIMGRVRATEPSLVIQKKFCNRTASLDRSKVLRPECAGRKPDAAPHRTPPFIDSPAHHFLPMEQTCPAAGPASGFSGT